MKLKRHQSQSSRGKYAVVRLNRVEAQPRGHIRTQIEHALAILELNGVLTYGMPRTADEFFVIMLKDVCSAPALVAYATAARIRCDDPEYADDIEAMASRAGHLHPNCKTPD